MKTRQFENANVGQVRQAYCRPETWTVPCELAPMMGPSVHAVGNHWTDGGEFGSSSDWGSGRPPGAPDATFQFKSVWDATAKELHNGEIVTVGID